MLARRLWLRLQTLFRRERVAQQLDDEIHAQIYFPPRFGPLFRVQIGVQTDLLHTNISKTYGVTVIFFPEYSTVLSGLSVSSLATPWLSLTNTT